MVAPRQIYWQDILFEQGIADLRNVGSQGLILPQGRRAQRPGSPVSGTVRWNSDFNQLEVYGSGIWAGLTTTGTTGFRSAITLGRGSSVLGVPAILPQLQFKSLVAGSGIRLARDANTITISARAGSSRARGANIGLGTAAVYDRVRAGVLNFRTFGTTTGSILSVYNGGRSEVLIDFVGTLGEVNTGRNLGRNAAVFVNKTGTAFNFRTIQSTSPIRIRTNRTDVIVALSANPIIPGTGSITIPIGRTASQPTAANGMLRYDRTTNQVMAVIRGTWTPLVTRLGTYVRVSGDTMTGTLELSSGNIVVDTGSVSVAAGNLTVTAGNATIGGMLRVTGAVTLRGTLNANGVIAAADNITMVAGKTIDGRDPRADGLVLDRINQSGTGIVRRIATNTFALRRIGGTSNTITVTNGDGVRAAPTITIADNPVIPGTAGMVVPVGTRIERAGSPTAGTIRWNSTTGLPEAYGTEWSDILTGAGGTITGTITLNGGQIAVTRGELIGGRNLTADGVIIDQLSQIVDGSGVVVHAGGQFTAAVIRADRTSGLEGAHVRNGDGRGNILIGLDIAGLATADSPTGTDLLPLYRGGRNGSIRLNRLGRFIGTTGFDALYVHKYGDTVNGNLRMDGGSITMTDNRASVRGTGGATTRTGGSFTINTISITVTSAQTVSQVANAINTNSSIIRNGTIFADTVGTPAALRIYCTGGARLVLANTRATPLTDMGIAVGTYSSVGKVDGRDVRADGAVLDSLNRATYLRVRLRSSAVNSGMNYPLAFGRADLRNDSSYVAGTHLVTPPRGTYRMAVYIEANRGTTAGTYTIRLRKNGTAFGPRGIVVGDASSTLSAYVEDMVRANGTDTFAIEVNNSAGSAGTLAEVIWTVHRIF